MPDIETLLLAMVKPLVRYPEKVRVDVEDRGDTLYYTLHVTPEDLGRIIGRGGRVANAIRSIVYSVRVEGHKRIRFEIEE